MMSCVWLAEVRAEKVMKCERYLLVMPFRSLSEVVRVLPVPVGPTHRTYSLKFSWVINFHKEKSILIISTNKICIVYIAIPNLYVPSIKLYAIF